jgi:hypothetical protein
LDLVRKVLRARLGERHRAGASGVVTGRHQVRVLRRVGDHPPTSPMIIGSAMRVFRSMNAFETAKPLMEAPERISRSTCSGNSIA